MEPLKHRDMRIPHTSGVDRRCTSAPVSVVLVLVPVPALAGSSETRIESRISILYEGFDAEFEIDR